MTSFDKIKQTHLPYQEEEYGEVRVGRKEEEQVVVKLGKQETEVRGGALINGGKTSINIFVSLPY